MAVQAECQAIASSDDCGNHEWVQTHSEVSEDGRTRVRRWKCTHPGCKKTEKRTCPIAHAPKRNFKRARAHEGKPNQPEI